MTIDKSALKAMAEAADSVIGDVNVEMTLASDSGPNQAEIDDVTEFMRLASPAAVLALLAEIDSLECRLEVSYDTLSVIRKILKTAESSVDQLKAENESLKRERTDWQAECLKKGFEYVREPDAHYVLADVPEMAALLGQLLGVEVRSKDNDDYGETVSSLNEQLEACNSVYGRAYDLEKEVEELKAKLDKAIEFQPIGEACLTNRDELRASLGLKRGDNLHEHVEMLRKDAERNNRMLVAAAITIGEICEALGIDNHSEPDMIVEAVREMRARAF